MEKYYITTPIYYVNDAPHIGHAYTNIVSDVIARFMRLENKEVLFLTGTDEHGQKIERTAQKNKIKIQDFVDQNTHKFRALVKLLSISNDDFIRTTELRHKNIVVSFWQKLVDSGNIYCDYYEGWYSVTDEAYYNESELKNGLAPTGSKVEFIKEPSYFFALSKWQDKLLDFYKKNPYFIYPNSKYNEVISFVKSGLQDLSVSRTTCNWGIKVPNDNEHTIYVWLDALINYISAIGYPNSEKYRNFWPANLHVVGKDIIIFHAVYWTAFLMAAELKLPKSIIAHGWWLNEGQKISKSIGNIIDPFKLAEEFDVEYIRYFLIREIKLGSDGNYSRDNLISRINNELINKIGNLVQRVVSFIYRNKAIITLLDDDIISNIYEYELIKNLVSFTAKLEKKIKRFEIHEILNYIVLFAQESNIFIEQEAPWVLKKTDPTKTLKILTVLLESIRYIAILLQPFIPCFAEKILDQIGVSKLHRKFQHLTKDYIIVPFYCNNSNTIEPKPIFIKINDVN